MLDMLPGKLAFVPAGVAKIILIYCLQEKKTLIRS